MVDAPDPKRRFERGMSLNDLRIGTPKTDEEKRFWDKINEQAEDDERFQLQLKICLTGGPCAGKTTAASVIASRLQNMGWRVFRVPEAATIIFSSGIRFPDLTDEQKYLVNLNILQVMLRLEDSFMELARSTKQRCVVLCDRGAMDVRAYMEEANWQAMMDETGFNTVNLRDSRYDCVIHLSTAADGAEAFYQTINNETRTESPDLARYLDDRIKKNWVGHPHFYVIDNQGQDFKTKISKAVSSVCDFLGEKSSDTLNLVKRKYLVKAIVGDFPHDFQDFTVEHDYIVSLDNTETRIRRRGQFGSYSYNVTVRYPEVHGQKLQLRRLLTARQFMEYKRQKDPERETVKKLRRSFLYKDYYYELDFYLSPHNGLCMMEAYLPSETDAASHVELPPFIQVERDVTNDKQYSMSHLSVKNSKAHYTPVTPPPQQQGGGR